MTPSQPLTADRLLEHSSFLHGLAFSLVHDEQHAEDVVQEAWLAVLQRSPPTHVGLRAWLASVTRNLALRTRRGEGRLRRREATAARPERTSATSEIAERVELQRCMADAVARLDEPGRSAIVWRYFDRLAPREIARREQVPVRTIESRLRRARESLRQRLDQDHGGSRSAWCAVLLPAFGLDATTLSSSSAAGATAASSTLATASTAGGLTAVAVGATALSTQLIVGVATVCVAGAFLVGRQYPAAPLSEGAHDAPVSSSTGSEGPLLGVSAENADPSAQRLATARKENAALSQTNAALETEIRALRTAARAAAPSGANRADGEGDRFAPEKFKKAVAGLNWPEAGEAAAKIVPLLVDLAAAFGRGEGIDEALGVKIFQHNQKLMNVVVTANAAKVPGAGENGSLTHPVVAINLIAAALETAEMPLDERQQERLREIGDRYIQDDERARSGYTDETFTLQKTINECALKDRMFADIDGVLRGEQRDVLHPASVYERLGIDIYSSGTIWYGVCKALPFESREELAAGLMRRFGSGAGISPEDRAIIQSAAKDWAASFSEAFLEASADPLAQVSQREAGGGKLAGWQKVEQARVAARHQLALYRAVVAMLPAGSDKVEQLRSAGRVLIPLRVPAK